MFDNLLNAARQTIIYSIGNISAKLVGFILLPLYTSYLTAAEYGMLAILETTSQVLIAIVGFRLPTAMMRWCADEPDARLQKSIVWTSLISLVFFVLLVDVLFLPFRRELSVLFFQTVNYSDYFLVLFISTSIQIVNQIPLTVLRFQEKPIYYITVSLLKLITILVLNIHFIVNLGLGVMGIILSQLIGSALLTLITLPFLLRNILPKFKFAVLKDMLSYGFPLIFSTMAAMVFTLGDRYLITYFLDYAALGIYSLSYKLASVLNVFIIQSFQLGFLPIAYKMFNRPDSSRYFSKVLTYYAWSLVFCGLALSLFAREIILLLAKDPDYFPAHSLVPIISLALIIKGIYYVFSIGLHQAKKTKYNAFIVITTAALSVGLNVALIPVIGVYGAALTAIAGDTLMALLYYRYSRKYYPIKYEIGKLLKMISLGILLFIIAQIVYANSVFWGVLTKVIVLAGFPVFLYFMGFYETVEINKLKELANKALYRITRRKLS